MTTRKIKDAKDTSTDELIYFRGHAKATYLSDGRSVEDALESINCSDSSSTSTTINVTYSDLVTLRNNNQLIPSQHYRITDYITTTRQEGTASANNKFDIIVEALTENMLNEEAKACLHDEDDYFKDCNLGAWNLWYDLENNTNRFDWADDENGKGVIYRMIDEWGNDCPYDFKNIMFFISINYPEDEPGGPYSMRSVEGNESGEVYEGYVFTFNYQEDGFNSDRSVKTNSCLWNIIKPRTYYGTSYSLNNIVFNTTTYDQCSNNIFGNDCYNIILGDNCYSNIFGEGCHDIVLEDYNYNNKFGNLCENCTLGNGCNSNIFGDWCYNNVFSDDCNYNTLGGDCFGNNLGQGCYYNTFNNSCWSNTFSENCSSNILGVNCGDNTFGDECYNNTLGNNCCNNTLGIYFNCNNLDSGIYGINLTNDSTASSETPVQYYHILSNVNGEDSNTLNIPVVRGLEFTTTVTKGSDGLVKQFNIADFINQ